MKSLLASWMPFLFFVMPLPIIAVLKLSNNNSCTQVIHDCGIKQKFLLKEGKFDKNSEILCWYFSTK